MEAEERAYAMAELGDQYFHLPTYGRTQDHATSYDKAFSPIQAPNSRPKKGTTTDSLLDAKQSTASPDAPVWSPTKPPQLSGCNADDKQVKQERSPSPSNSAVGERFIQDMVDLQRRQQQHSEQLMHAQEIRDQQLQRLLGQHQQLALTLSLPHTEVQTFKGDPTSYCDYVRSFESLIESKTLDSTTRLNYLVQYTSGDVRDLMRSWQSVKPHEGYQEARRLLKERYGQGFKIATAFIDRLMKGPPINNYSGSNVNRHGAAD